MLSIFGEQKQSNRGYIQDIASLTISVVGPFADLSHSMVHGLSSLSITALCCRNHFFWHLQFLLTTVLDTVVSERPGMLLVVRESHYICGDSFLMVFANHQKNFDHMERVEKSLM